MVSRLIQHIPSLPVFPFPDPVSIFYSCVFLQEILRGEKIRKKIRSGYEDPERRRYREKWLPNKDSNLDKLNQNQLCYRYTIGQYARECHSLDSANKISPELGNTS